MVERNVKLEEIQGLLTVKKVKPNIEKASTRVTQVHGSMRARDVASLVKDIKEQKEKKALDHKSSLWFFGVLWFLGYINLYMGL
jgi:hypothetical protein